MGTPHLDLSGRTFGRLTVQHYAGDGFWQCVCECGNGYRVKTERLKNGHTRSCGCLHRDTVRPHGGSGTKVHGVWLQMRWRCNSPACPSYHNYGGRGIKVCDRWDKFENFLADMGPRPEGAWLDRTDNDGPYSPENCQWVSPKSNQNNKRTNVLMEFNGKTQTATEWSEELGISYWTLLNRLRRGWSHAKALGEPIRAEFRNKGDKRS